MGNTKSTKPRHIRYDENIISFLKTFIRGEKTNNDLFIAINKRNGTPANSTLKNAFNPNKDRITVNIVQWLFVFVLKKETENNKELREIILSLNKLLARFCWEDLNQKNKNEIVEILEHNSEHTFQFSNVNNENLLIFQGKLINGNTLSYSNQKIILNSIIEEIRLIKQKIIYKTVKKEITEISNFTKDTIESRIRITDYYDIINEILPVFVGRKFVFDEIDEFVSNNNKGYFYVRANPGIGKTSLSIKLVEDTGYPFHIINPQRNGTDRYAKDFISNTCAQLIKKHNLPFEHFPEDYGDDGGFLYTVLRAVSNKVENDEKVVIVVDGLDELKQEELTFFAKENILYLPDTLPPNIFFVITMRDLSKKGIKLPAEISKDFLIEDKGDDNIDDVREFIEIASKDKRFAQYLKKNKVSKKEFLKTLENKSEGNFMYLKHIFREILLGDYKDIKLEELPQGLDGYYKDHWDRMMTKTDGISNDIKLKTIYVLANINSPMSRKGLTEIIKSDTDSVSHKDVRKIIDGWRQFLTVSLDEDDTEVYNFYHKSFLDFLASDDMIEAIGDDYPNIAERVELNYYDQNIDELLEEDDDL